ncbi:hypothetical protein AKJ64_04075 [candidate division MSBL1 archaeon SCGC-AAA259E17]|uniref:Uncharacterized protein n=1 Tax=candidate division MSBL1 archaeon SCGC-AAA259E17 TaxID=1698263 RepID=A0A133UD13_9EURY|nr:hypothetical protein AKJ64_04075 [candidate division MSBL1 archaeon SCGC-AAA259E17]
MRLPPAAFPWVTFFPFFTTRGVLKRIFEPDPSKAVKLFKRAREGEESLAPGSVDWLEDYFFDE